MNKLHLMPFFLFFSNYAMEAKVLLEKTQEHYELFEAVYYGNEELVMQSIRNGLDPNGLVSTGFNFLQLAVTRNDYYLSKALVEKKADVNACGSDGFTALHDAVLVNNPRIVIMLLLYGAKVDAKVYDGTTALHMAVQCGNHHVVRLLLEDVAEVNARTDYGRTPLFDAVAAGNSEIVKLLIENGAKVDICGDTIVHLNKVKTKRVRVSPLHMAVGRGNKDIICQLLKAGTKVNMIGADGFTALDYADKLKGESVQRLLVSRGAKKSSDISSFISKHLSAIEL